MGPGQVFWLVGSSYFSRLPGEDDDAIFSQWLP